MQVERLAAEAVDEMSAEAVMAMRQQLLTARAALEDIAKRADAYGLRAKEALQEMQKPQAAPDRTGLVYYKNNSCNAASADAPDCICWTPEKQPQAVPAQSPAEGDEPEPAAWLVTWKGEKHEYAHAHASEMPAVDQARIMGGKCEPLYRAAQANVQPKGTAKCNCTAYCGQYLMHGSCPAYPAAVTVVPAPAPLTSVCHMECGGCIDAGKCAFPGKPAEPARYPHPDEDDAVTLWAEIHRLRAAVQGPDGYATWQEAATAERVRRVAAEKALAATQAPAPAPEVPAGFKLVPVEPTQAMLDAVVTTLDDHLLGAAAEQQYREDWAATLAAAPAAPCAAVAPSTAEPPKRCEHVRHLHLGNNKNFCKACGLWVWASDGIDVGEPGADDRAHAEWCRNNIGAWGCGREARGGSQCENWCGNTACAASLKDGRPAGLAFRVDDPASQPPVQGSGQ